MYNSSVRSTLKIATTLFLPTFAVISVAQIAPPSLGVKADFGITSSSIRTTKLDDDSNGSGKEFCLWLGFPLMFEAKVPSTQIGVSAGLAPWELKTMDQFGDTTNLTIGLGGMAQVAFYSKPTLDGVGYFIRTGYAAGTTYFAPGVSWVNRTSGSSAYRYGFAIPIGSNLFPFVAEFAYGIQF